jgi:hypothetical protein
VNAILAVIRGCERDLKLPPVPEGERIDAILKAALKGGLDERRYNIIWFLKNFKVKVPQNA